MEQLVIGNIHDGEVDKVSAKEKIIFYNQKGEILVYRKAHGIYIPAKISEDIVDDMVKIIPYSFDRNKLEELIQVIFYEFKFEAINNKMHKKYLKLIRNYYVCLADFDRNLEKELKSIETNVAGIMHPKVVTIEEAIIELQNTYKGFCHEEAALKALDRKIKLKER